MRRRSSKIFDRSGKVINPSGAFVSARRAVMERVNELKMRNRAMSRKVGQVPCSVCGGTGIDEDLLTHTTLLIEEYYCRHCGGHGSFRQCLSA